MFDNFLLIIESIGWQLSLASSFCTLARCDSFFDLNFGFKGFCKFELEGFESKDFDLTGRRQDLISEGSKGCVGSRSLIFVGLLRILGTTEGGGGRICEGLTALVSRISLEGSLDLKNTSFGFASLRGVLGSCIWGTICIGGGLSELSRETGDLREAENIEEGGPEMIRLAGFLADIGTGVWILEMR